LNIVEFKNSIITQLNDSSLFDGVNILNEYENRNAPIPLNESYITVGFNQNCNIDDVFNNYYGKNTSNNQITGKLHHFNFIFTIHCDTAVKCEQIYVLLLQFLASKDFEYKKTSSNAIKFDKTADCFILTLTTLCAFIEN